MRRRLHLVAHTLMIALIVIILFPVVWVVMTSIRRDNAAFSPKLFSSNLTLQHYKDLLLPPRNVPVLVSELGNAISLSDPFKRNQKKAEQIIEKDIRRLIDYDSKTRSISKFVERHGKSLNDDAEDSAKRELKILREELKKFFSGVDGEIDPVSAIYVEKHLGKGGSWIRPIVSEEDYSNYEKSIGAFLKREEELEKSIEDLKGEIGSVKNQLSEESMRSVNILNEIKTLKPDLEKIDGILKSLSSLPSGFHPNLKDVSKQLEDLLEEVKKFEDLSDIGKALEEILNDLDSLKVSEDSEGAFKSAEVQLETLIRDLKIQVDEFQRSYERLRKLEKDLSDKTSKLEKLQKNLKITRDEIEKFESDHSKDIRKAYLFYLKWELLGIVNFPDMVRSWEGNSLSDVAKMFGVKTFINVKKCLIRMKRLKGEMLRRKEAECTKKILGRVDEVAVISKLNEAIRKEIPYVENLGIDESVLNSIMNSSEWASDYLKFRDSSKKLITYLGSLVGEFQKEVVSLSGKWRALLDISRSGIPVVPSEITRMNEILSTVYESKVSGMLGISMREARMLADEFPVKNDRKIFKEIDSKLYSLQQIWKKKPRHFFLRWVMNSIIVASSVAVITTVITALAAYPFSRMRFFGRRYGIMTLLLIQMFPSIMYMVALYGMLAFLGKIVPWLGLDTLGGLTFVYLGNIAFNMFLIKGFYDTIPSSLEESAMIDGATRFQTFWRIVLPLAKPILAVVLILTFMGTFNEYVLARIVLQDVRKYTYALGLWQFTVGPFETEWGLFTAAALLGMIPMVALFLSMQRFLISGLTKGAVKG